MYIFVFMNEDTDIDIDIQWWKAVKQNYYPAFEKLFQKYYESLCCYAEGLLADGMVAEDVVQDMFIHFWEKRDTIDVKDSLRAYFYTCVRHRSLKILQKQMVARKHNSQLTEFVEYLLHSEYSVEEEQEIERIKSIMQDLPAQCLKVFMMSAIEGKKYSEISEELSISVNTVKTHVSKAYKIIRAQLHSEGSLILWYWIIAHSGIVPIKKLSVFSSYSK